VKVLIYPHDLAIGGSQLNAIEIASAIRGLGHEAIIFGPEGPLVATIRRHGLEFIPAPRVGRRPSPAAVGALTDVIDRAGIDVVHGYEWPPILEALIAVRRRPQVAAVGTIMSMAVAPFLPVDVPLLVGTTQIMRNEARRRRDSVGLLEPPVDTFTNHPDHTEGVAEFRARYGLRPNALSVVCVSRLARELKLEGLLSAIEGVASLPEQTPCQLIIVGDGPARDEVQSKASQVNAKRPGTVILTGSLSDPRPAYAAADVALGMGGSALRAMAFGKPLVVQGERGFWKTLTPDTLSGFLWGGWYGVGPGAEQGPRVFVEQLAPLLADEEKRRLLGRFGRQTVEERFSLHSAATRQVDFYQNALDARPSRWWSAAKAGASSRFVGYLAGRQFDRVRGQLSVDDFNSKPLLGRREKAQPSELS
jgi:L-malate glycosyltransferase